MRPKMRFSLLATLFMSLNPTLSVPLETDFSLDPDMFASSGDFNFFDTTTSLEPGSSDYSLMSPVDDFADLFSAPSLFADDSGNENQDIQLLSSSDSQTSCPLGRRKRDSRTCNPLEAPSPGASPILTFPSLMDNGPGQEGSTEKSQVAPLENFNIDPCLATVEYPMHVCCKGPPGPSRGGVYITIENCALG